MKYTFFVVFYFCMINSYCQEEDFELFGKTLAESIVSKDSITFQSLILPKEAVIEKFKDEAASNLSDSDVEYTINNINENYDNITSTTFGFTFLNLTNKTEIFNLDLKNVKYRIVEIDEIKKDSNITAIHGTINNDTFSHFTFYAVKFKGKLYLASHLIYISEINKFDERKRLKKVKLSSDDKGNLIAKGIIKLDNRTTSKEDILRCIVNSPITIGVEETSEMLDEKSSFEYVKGKWQYTYYVNNSDDFAGVIEFKYEFIITNGEIEYKYYDFIHSKENSEFNSIGQLPFEINESVIKTFTKQEYSEILKDIHFNQVLAIKRTKEFTDKCFK